jgi:hypothetical protein
MDTPVAQQAVASSYFGGVLSGCVLLVFCSLWAPSFARRSHAALTSVVGRSAGSGEAESLLLSSNAVDERDASPGHRDLNRDMFVVRLREQLQAATTESDGYRALLYSTPGASGSVWDRREFLQAAGAHLGLLMTILDEHLADAFTGEGAQARLATMLRVLLMTTAEKAAALLAERRSALLMATVGTQSAAVAEAWAAGPAFASYYRSSLEMAWGSFDWKKAAEGVVQEWVRRGGSQLAFVSDGAMATLVEAVVLHLKLAQWPELTNSDIIWASPGSAMPSTVPFSDEVHMVFSLTGAIPSQGSQVLTTGLELRARSVVPSTLPGASKAKRAAITVAELAELRGRACRTIVM